MNSKEITIGELTFEVFYDFDEIGEIEVLEIYLAKIDNSPIKNRRGEYIRPNIDLFINEFIESQITIDFDFKKYLGNEIQARSSFSYVNNLVKNKKPTEK